MLEKIDILPILRQHIDTLSDKGGSKPRPSDIILFYVLPLAPAIGSYLWLAIANDDHVQTVVALYAIFSALLISAQVVLYTVFRSMQREAEIAANNTATTKNAELRQKDLRVRMDLVKEVNINVSYLLILSATALFSCGLFIFIEIIRKLEDAILVYISVHFFLSLLMIVKRMHVLFDTAYKTD